MSKIDLQLIELIKQNKTLNEICDILNLTNKQVYRHLLNLKNYGYTFLRDYYYDGNIAYKQIIGAYSPEKDTTEILMNKNDKIFKAIVLSDLHIGCDKQRLDLLNQIYDYYIKNGINIILNTGDLVDGWIGQNKKINKDINHQLDYLIKKYPFDKNILNFICLGNHDVHSFNKFGINLKFLLLNYRHDLIALSSGTSYINVKNENIIMKHALNYNKPALGQINNSIILEGHHHKFLTNFNKKANNYHIFTPSLSEIYINNVLTLPSALEIQFSFTNKGKFKDGRIMQLISTGNEMVRVNEFEIKDFNHDEKIIEKHNKNKQDENISTLTNTDKTPKIPHEGKITIAPTERETDDIIVSAEPKPKVKSYTKNNDFENLLKEFKKQDRSRKKNKYE